MEKLQEATRAIQHEIMDQGLKVGVEAKWPGRPVYDPNRHDVIYSTFGAESEAEIAIL